MKRIVLFAVAAVLVATPAFAQQAPANDEPTPSPSATPHPAPAPTAAPKDEAPPDSDDDAFPPARRKGRFFGSLDGGYAYKNLYATDVTGYDLALVLGGDLGDWAMGGVLELDRGVTVEGLVTTTCNGGFLVEGHAGRFRMGGGFRFGGIAIQRETNETSLTSPSAGAFVRASLDLVSFHEGRHAVFVVAKGSVDTVGTELWGASAGVGMRF